MFLISDDYWQIQKTKEKGYGVFAKKEIKKGTIIGDYLGKVIKTADRPGFNLPGSKKTGYSPSKPLMFAKLLDIYF